MKITKLEVYAQAMGIHKTQLTLSRGIWENSTKKAKLIWMLGSNLGSPGEEAGERPGHRAGRFKPLSVEGWHDHGHRE